MLSNVGQEIKARFIGPVQILEDEKNWELAREGSEEVFETDRETMPLDVRRCRVDRDVLQFWKEPGERGSNITYRPRETLPG